MKRAGLYQRGKGKTWYIRYKKANGIIRRESAKTTSKKEAQAFLEKRRTQVREGTLPDTSPAKRYTFNELANEYLADGDVQALKSFNKERRYRVNQLMAKFGNLALADFNTKIVKRFKTERLKVNKAATVNRTLALLKHMFKEGVEYEMVSEEVFNKVRKVKLVKENNRRLRYLSQEECKELIDACSPHLKPIVITALNAGMRLGEILNLKWEQVDLKHGFILLSDTKNGERREIPINYTLRATLEAMPHGPESLYVFTNKDGNPFKSVSTSFPAACYKAGIKDFRFHDLRHTFASQLVMSDVSIQKVMKLLGHKTLTMTLRYAHLAPSHLVEAVRILDKNNGVSDTVSDTGTEMALLEGNTVSCKSL
ncbi:MAG: tyrosine-type recombinase/integrase [Planctomycetota bacterium]|jgi:integrase